MSKASAAAPPWRPKEKLEEAIALLIQLQSAETRDTPREHSIAKEASEYLHLCDTQDFMSSVRVAAQSAFWSRYLPKAWLESHKDWARCAVAMCGSVEAAWQLERRPGPALIETYFYGLEMGTDLGYPDEMGNKWYIHLSDSTGTFYIPIDAVVEILGAGCS